MVAPLVVPSPAAARGGRSSSSYCLWIVLATILCLGVALKRYTRLDESIAAAATTTTIKKSKREEAEDAIITNSTTILEQLQQQQKQLRREIDSLQHDKSTLVEEIEQLKKEKIQLLQEKEEEAAAVVTETSLPTPSPSPESTSHDATGSTSSTITTRDDHHFSQDALDAFLQALRDNPEATGVRPWTWTSSSSLASSWQFDGFTYNLLQEAFQGRRVGLVGDSTLLYMGKWFQALFSPSKTFDAEQIDSLQDMDLSEANRVINPTTDPYVGFPGAAKSEVKTAEYHIQWAGFAGGFGAASCRLQNIWDRMNALKPEILVVNFGMHWLHLQGGGRDVVPCQVQYWLKYEDWLSDVLKMAQEQWNTRLVLFKTTNYICQEKFDGQYGETVGRYQQERQQQLSNNNPISTTTTSLFDVCVESLQTQITNADQPVDDIHYQDIVRYCKEGTFDLVGSQNLNERMKKFVIQQQQDNNHNMTIGLFNDHMIQSCEHTKPQDGRHYHSLNLLRIRLLANMIQAMF